MDIQSVKQRFGIIGNDSKLNLAIEKAVRIAPTDVSVLITGESGVGKEAFARIIHTLSARKHAKYVETKKSLGRKIYSYQLWGNPRRYD